MTASEYFSIALPTDEDFKAWTKSLFARADRANRRFAKKYPELADKPIDKLPLFEN